MNNNFAKIIRIATIPPVFAFFSMLFMYILKSNYFDDIAPLIVGISFLCVLPTLAYPAQHLLPHFKESGRQGQRTLAIIFSVVGYIVCCLFAIFEPFSNEVLIYFLTYLISGIFLLVCSLFHLKPSGHACGVIGPVAFLSIFVSPCFLVGLLAFVLTLWSSLKLKRHTVGEFLLGAIIPIVAMLLSSWIVLGF